MLQFTVQLLALGAQCLLRAFQAGVMDVTVTEPLIRKIDDARRAIERYSNPTIVFTSVLLDIAIARKNASTRGNASYAA